MAKLPSYSVIVACLMLALAGCTDLRFGPGFSMTNLAYFSEPPLIIIRDNQYSLRWRYGSLGFYFFPESKVVNGQLLFSLQSTSSSGDRSGRYGEISITDERKVAALQLNGAFWIEPDGTKVRLEVKPL